MVAGKIGAAIHNDVRPVSIHGTCGYGSTTINWEVGVGGKSIDTRLEAVLCMLVCHVVDKAQGSEHAAFHG